MTLGQLDLTKMWWAISVVDG